MTRNIPKCDRSHVPDAIPSLEAEAPTYNNPPPYSSPPSSPSARTAVASEWNHYERQHKEMEHNFEEVCNQMAKYVTNVNLLEAKVDEYKQVLEYYEGERPRKRLRTEY